MDLNQLVSHNQTIKIVPSVEDSLRSMGLNVHLEDNVKLWLTQLKATWKTWKKSATIESHIEMFFYSIPDPHRVALIFVIKCEEYKDGKPKSLPYFIMETLQKWSQTNGVVAEDSLKIPAFHIATHQRNQHFLNLIVKTYNVKTITETILPTVRTMIKEDNCRLASQIVIAMELFNEIPVEDLLFPLILQDKTNMIDQYLSECPDQVKPLLMFLDNLLDKSFSIREYVQKYIHENKIGHVKHDKLHYKPLGKLVARLCSKFNIPIETCKNLSKNRTTGGLRYLIRQKYQENNVSLTVWDDLVKDSLKQSADSAKDFIDMLSEYDRKEALKWVEYFQIPEKDLPSNLRNLSLNEVVTEENWESPTNSTTPQEFYKIPLTEDQIIIIDNGEAFYDLISNLAKSSVVSIDCEWKPSFGASQPQVALIQVATLSNVYLIDTMVLNKPQYSSFWYSFFKTFLDNAEVIKLGFGLEQDLKEMKASVVGLSNIKIKGEGLLDLNLLWKSLIESGLTLPSSSETGGSSLSSVVQACFGCPLEKSEQCSNWELRPLRNTQIQYAALDAYVLLQIYYCIQKLCQEQGLNFDEICNDVMLEGKKKCAKKSKGPDKYQVVERQEIQSQELKLLVDPVLFNLMPYLRCCGVDAVAIPVTMLWHDVINLAISEERLIVNSKPKCTPTMNFSQSSILDVGKGNVKEQIEKILTNFKVTIRESDLLTRCLNCNSKQIRKLSSIEVSDVCCKYQQSMKCNYQKPDSDDEDDIVDMSDYGNYHSDSESEKVIINPRKTHFNATKNTGCVTDTGVPVRISNVNQLLQTEKPGILCDDCGQLFWEGDEFMPIVGLVHDITKLTVKFY